MYEVSVWGRGGLKSLEYKRTKRDVVVGFDQRVDGCGENGRPGSESRCIGGSGGIHYEDLSYKERLKDWPKLPAGDTENLRLKDCPEVF